MSVVATQITDKEIVLAADSFIGIGMWAQDKREDAKAHKSENGVIFGAVGYTEEINLMRLFLKTHRPAAPNEDELLDFMSEFHNWVRKTTGNQSYALLNSWHFIFDGHAFLCHNGYNIREITDHDAIGAGLVQAKTALSLGMDAERSVEVACDLSIYCEKPVNVFRVARGTK